MGLYNVTFDLVNHHTRHPSSAAVLYLVGGGGFRKSLTEMKMS